MIASGPPVWGISQLVSILMACHRDPTSGIHMACGYPPPIPHTLQAHPPWSSLSCSLILVPDTSSFHSQNKPRGSSVEGMVVMAGVGESTRRRKPWLTEDRKLGFW